MATPSPKTDPRLLPGLALGVLAALTLSLLMGPDGLGLPADGPARRLILMEIRLPRVVFGLLVGAGLGIAGAALQGYLRNPLAEPGLLGVSGGAALGAVLAIHTGLAGTIALALPLAGLAGAMAATAVLLLLAGRHDSPVVMVLAGVAVSSLAAAAMSLALNLSRNPFAAAESIFWTMGSLADRSSTQMLLAGPLIIGGMALLGRLARTLDGLTLGDDVARSLGLDLARARFGLIAGVALAVGAATAVTGMIGFVGLVVPHLLRPWTDGRPSALLWPSALGGALLLLLADVAVRVLAPVADVRIGVLTAVLGAPFFLWLVLRLDREFAR